MINQVVERVRGKTEKFADETVDTALAQLRYGELQDNVIVPAMLNVAGNVRESGVDYKIIVGDTKVLSTSIRFFIGDSDKGIENRPSFTVMYAPPYDCVTFQENDTSSGTTDTGGKVGPAGNAKFDDVTQDFIESKLLSLLQRVL